MFDKLTENSYMKKAKDIMMFYQNDTYNLVLCVYSLLQ